MTSAFRIIAFLEGLSYILLLFIAVPIKYFFSKDPTYVKMLGMPHGLLFVCYIALAILLQKHYKWDLKTLAIVLVASILPFGTFYIEKRYLKAQ